MAGKLRALLLVISLGAVHAVGQQFTADPYGIPVSTAGGPLAHPFIGGLYNPMHQFLDIDGDGDLDLFLFDVNDGSLMFFRNAGTATQASLHWEKPAFTLPVVNAWFRFADLDGNGLPDLLTAGDSLNTLAWYTNMGTASVPVFTLATPHMRDSLGVAVYVQQQCIPAFADIDGDGDNDLFTLNPGTGTINFYENAGSVQAPLFVFRTAFYQQIQICTGCSRPAELHGQGSMDFSDIDADGDADMLYGDLFDAGLFFYRNIGTLQHAVLDSVTSRFPPAAPVLTAGFNQPTLADIDGDGDRDLFVSVLPPFQGIDNLACYENRGTPSAYDFHLVSKNWVSSVDVGLQSVPALADLDADGDADLLIGGLFGAIALLRNTGTAAAPAFMLEDTAYIADGSRFGYAPALADIDADGDPDLLAGHFGGSIDFYRNDGSPVSPLFVRVPSFFDSIAVGMYAAPALTDADDDGDLDLFVGNGDGRLAFYRNTGSPQTWHFERESTAFQDIDVGDNARPVFVDIDTDGDRDLVVGTAAGTVVLLRNDGPPGAPVFTPVTGAFDMLEPVRESSPAFGDIDADSDPDLMLGSLRGGIQLYRNTAVTSVRQPAPGTVQPDALDQNVPNPFNGTTRITYRVHGSGSGTRVRLAVFDLLGREVAVPVDDVRPDGSYSVAVDAGGLASGTYFYRLEYGSVRETRKLLLVR
jgi:hypothetical protein